MCPSMKNERCIIMQFLYDAYKNHLRTDHFDPSQLLSGPDTGSFPRRSRWKFTLCTAMWLRKRKWAKCERTPFRTIRHGENDECGRSKSCSSFPIPGRRFGLMNNEWRPIEGRNDVPLRAGSYKDYCPPRKIWISVPVCALFNTIGIVCMNESASAKIFTAESAHFHQR